MAMATTSSGTVAILGMGDMGSAVGAALVRAGVRVVTDLSRRGAHSRVLAARAGVEDLGSLAAVVRDAGLVLSIVPPAAAAACAANVAGALHETGAAPVYADCNAVAPATVRQIARLFDGTGAPFVDASIIGVAPKPRAPRTRFYASGSARAALRALAAAEELELGELGDEVGTASALKMVYAGLNKGTDALYTAVLLAAARLGELPALLAECEHSQRDPLARMRARVPFLASTSARFTGEMAEIAAALESVGVTPDFHRGAEWLYALLATTPLAAETRDAQPRERSLDTALTIFGAALDRGEQQSGQS
jgi:3-hydroxyisobutyrate dehydrogenase-like beta-hydroxyacid dehydrogenase